MKLSCFALPSLSAQDDDDDDDVTPLLISTYLLAVVPPIRMPVNIAYGAGWPCTINSQARPRTGTKPTHADRGGGGIWEIYYRYQTSGNFSSPGGEPQTLR